MKVLKFKIDADKIVPSYCDVYNYSANHTKTFKKDGDDKIVSEFSLEENKLVPVIESEESEESFAVRMLIEIVNTVPMKVANDIQRREERAAKIELLKVQKEDLKGAVEITIEEE